MEISFRLPERAGVGSDMFRVVRIPDAARPLYWIHSATISAPRPPHVWPFFFQVLCVWTLLWGRVRPTALVDVSSPRVRGVHPKRFGRVEGWSSARWTHETVDSLRGLNPCAFEL